MTYDVIVVGGSYAGMSSALQIARARRNVMVIDAGRRRNRAASHSHGFLGQDGADPEEIAGLARRQLLAYPSVVWTEAEAMRVARTDDAFAVTTSDGATYAARRLILALGVSDELPDVAGLAERWGKTIFHCPYCHGYELDGGPIGVLAVGAVSLHQALLLPDWGPTTLFVNETFEPDEKALAELASRNVIVERAAVSRIGGEADVELTDGRIIALAGLFTAPRTRPNGTLADGLGCAHDEGPLGPYLRVDGMQQTSVPHVFACGDAARSAGTVALAVGDGAIAGTAAHRSLIFT